MNKFLAAFLIAFGLMTGAAHADVQIGKTAPDYTFKDINGATHTISKLKGKTIVLEWQNPGCPFVHKFYDAKEMQRVQADALKDSNVVWFTINSSGKGKEGNIATDAEAKKYVAEQGMKSTAYVLDASGKFGKLYGAKTTPHMFVIDKNGNVAYQGAIDSIKSADQDDIKKADNYVVKALAALKDGKQPEVTSTEPYGCGVKYAD